MSIFGTKKGPKYNNQKSKSLDGHTFDSKKELNRYNELRLMLAKGIITDLVLQPSFSFTYEGRPIKRMDKGSKCLRYIADFSYKNLKGELVVEDVKGFKTKDFLIKQALFETIYGIKLTLI